MRKRIFTLTLSTMLLMGHAAITQQAVAKPASSFTLSEMLLNGNTSFIQKVLGKRNTFEKNSSLAVSPLFNATHVYVKPEYFDQFTDSFIATFGGTKSEQGVYQVTPTPSQTMSQFVLSPVGTLSVFGFKTPVPYPFGSESIGYLVKDFDRAVQFARSNGAEIIVAPFTDLAGRDAVIRWPGGFTSQLYWIETIPDFEPLQTIPESRVYVSPEAVNSFVKKFVNFTQGKVVSDHPRAAGIEIGRPNEFYRRIRIESNFGKMTVFVTDGHLPFPYGRETTGFEVQNLNETLDKAQKAGAKILVNPVQTEARESAMVQFPGEYIAEIHARLK
ncbi:glyoxalase [Acinetobacter shaoyimingii]|uniref:glyoxalase n=1 Tax=Acinetobacter shaoyimingii TaxID=2715164 RepID=UPI002231566E|nr:glyoxalase [Acinetobacter shaoyimingii]